MFYNTERTTSDIIHLNWINLDLKDKCPHFAKTLHADYVHTNPFAWTLARFSKKARNRFLNQCDCLNFACEPPRARAIHIPARVVPLLFQLIHRSSDLLCLGYSSSLCQLALRTWLARGLRFYHDKWPHPSTINQGHLDDQKKNPPEFLSIFWHNHTSQRWISPFFGDRQAKHSSTVSFSIFERDPSLPPLCSRGVSFHPYNLGRSESCPEKLRFFFYSTIWRSRAGVKKRVPQNVIQIRWLEKKADKSSCFCVACQLIASPVLIWIFVSSFCWVRTRGIAANP